MPFRAFLAGAHHHGIEIGRARAGDELLHAIDDVDIPLAPCPRLQRGASEPEPGSVRQ